MDYQKKLLNTTIRYNHKIHLLKTLIMNSHYKQSLRKSNRLYKEIILPMALPTIISPRNKLFSPIAASEVLLS